MPLLPSGAYESDDGLAIRIRQAETVLRLAKAAGKMTHPAVAAAKKEKAMCEEALAKFNAEMEKL